MVRHDILLVLTDAFFLFDDVGVDIFGRQLYLRPNSVASRAAVKEQKNRADKKYRKDWTHESVNRG